MPKIYISPSSQYDNTYAYGNTNEGEQCHKIAEYLDAALVRCGFDVKVGKTGNMESRMEESNKWGADLHLPVHTNAFNGRVSGTRIFAYSKPSVSWDIAEEIFHALAPVTPGTSENIKTYPALYELRKAKNRAVYVEVDFHDVPDVARWIIENPQTIAEAICRGLCTYYNKEYVSPGKQQLYHVQVGAFTKKGNADYFLQTVQEHFPDAFIVKY